MDVGTGVELECSYGAGDGRTRSGVASMPKERSGGPRLDRSCDWEKYGYDTSLHLFPSGLDWTPYWSRPGLDSLCCSANYQKCVVNWDVLCCICVVVLITKNA